MKRLAATLRKQQDEAAKLDAAIAAELKGLGMALTLRIVTSGTARRGWQNGSGSSSAPRRQEDKRPIYLNTVQVALIRSQNVFDAGRYSVGWLISRTSRPDLGRPVAVHRGTGS